ncbi:unnamed protein product [Peniophora sp. CBMAI 1063]|nr:unnamed protein product [Peniophora sp. CBMAI 1063]
MSWSDQSIAPLLLVFSSPDLSNATLSCAYTGVRMFTLRQGTHPYTHRRTGSGPRRVRLPRAVLEDADSRAIASLECDSDGAPSEICIAGSKSIPISQLFEPALTWDDLSAPREKGFQLSACTGGLWHISRLRIRLLDSVSYAPRAKFYHNHVLHRDGRLEPATGKSQGHDFLWVKDSRESLAEMIVTFVLLEHARRVVYQASTYQPQPPAPVSPSQPRLRKHLSNISAHLLHLTKPRCPPVEEPWNDLDGNELETAHGRST